ncbi:MAG: M28 family peptidase [bacterium]|nr:M28 family peptidase [bacterium]
MRIDLSTDASRLDPAAEYAEIANRVSEDRLRQTVETISVPRNFFRELAANQRIAKWIFERFAALDLAPRFQGEFSNVVAMTPACGTRPAVLIGAHYDSVPGCPGADDNGSAVAAMLECAELVGHHFRQLPLCFVAFNCEEDGLLGSADFVDGFVAENAFPIRLAHVLEMVGYCDSRPGSQRTPPEFPVRVPDAGDFLGLIANGRSAKMASQVLALARGFFADFPVMSLHAYLGLEHVFPDLKRSDHSSFWQRKIPALMWTDTAEFRNHNYHRASDTPDTLDYGFLKRVTQLLLISSLTSAADAAPGSKPAA